MSVFNINEPIWKSRSVGLDRHKVANGDNVVTVFIRYKNKKGDYEFPGKHTIPKSVALNFSDHPKKPNGITLIEIPIAAFKVVPHDN